MPFALYLHIQDASKCHSLQTPLKIPLHLQEVFSSTATTSGYGALVLWYGREDAEFGLEILSDVHDGCDVTAAVAVIRGGPDSDDRFLWEVVLVLILVFVDGFDCGMKTLTYLISLIDQLMSTRNELQAIDMVEFASDLISKEPACTTGRNGPGLYVLWIRPDEIAEGTFMWNLLGTCNNADLINGADFRAKTTVNAEDFTIDDSGKD